MYPSIILDLSVSDTPSRESRSRPSRRRGRRVGEEVSHHTVLGGRCFKFWLASHRPTGGGHASIIWLYLRRFIKRCLPTNRYPKASYLTPCWHNDSHVERDEWTCISRLPAACRIQNLGPGFDSYLFSSSDHPSHE